MRSRRGRVPPNTTPNFGSGWLRMIGSSVAPYHNVFAELKGLG